MNDQSNLPALLRRLSDVGAKMTNRKITVSRIKTEASGDWHDKPLRWIVSGPAGELQKFSTRKDAQKYKSIRFRSYDQKIAINKFVREG